MLPTILVSARSNFLSSIIIQVRIICYRSAQIQRFHLESIAEKIEVKNSMQKNRPIQEDRPFKKCLVIIVSALSNDIRDIMNTHITI